jgi:hypothetical protein
LIAITSGISMIPAFNAWTESPEPGISTSSTVSAIPITSTSLWPGPDGLEQDDVLAGRVEQQRCLQRRLREPAEWPRVPIERMKTPGSRKWSESLIRSPRSAPCVKGSRGRRDDADRRLAPPARGARAR